MCVNVPYEMHMCCAVSVSYLFAIKNDDSSDLKEFHNTYTLFTSHISRRKLGPGDRICNSGTCGSPEVKEREGGERGREREARATARTGESKRATENTHTLSMLQTCMSGPQNISGL